MKSETPAAAWLGKIKSLKTPGPDVPERITSRYPQRSALRQHRPFKHKCAKSLRQTGLEQPFAEKLPVFAAFEQHACAHVIGCREISL